MFKILNKTLNILCIVIINTTVYIFNNYILLFYINQDYKVKKGQNCEIQI